MQADIYSASVTQDANSGAATKQWSQLKTIDCFARSILRKDVGENSTSVKISEYLIILGTMVKIRSLEAIPSSARVVNIRNSSGVIYVEDQDPSSVGGLNGSTIFEPRGSTPIANFDGSILEYETILMRQEVQRLG